MQIPDSSAVDRLRRGDQSAIPAVAAALAQKDDDLRAHAALALYELKDVNEFGKHPDLGANLRIAVKDGHRSAAALLLLAYFPGHGTEQLLQKVIAEQPGAQTKLMNWGPVVPASLPAMVAASRLGVRESRRYLLDHIEQMPVTERVFLLGVMREIDAPEVLHRLAASLSDQTVIAGGAPTGAEGQWRVCDLAAEALVTRLELPVNFKVEPGVRYSDQQIDEVRKVMRATVPQ